MREVVIVSGARTAIGTFGGSLKDVPVVKLGAIVIREVLKKAGLKPVTKKEVLDLSPEVFKGTGLTELEKTYGQWEGASKEIQVDEVIMGNVLPAGQGQNLARQATIYGGIPKETNAFTINKLCDNKT